MTEPRDKSPEGTAPISTGSSGLDEILCGGYSTNRVHLIEGQPGSGKTTLALQFLLDGRKAGERVLYITLSETKDELYQSAQTHGWSLDGIDIFELVPPELSLDPQQQQSVVYASDLELGETVQMAMAEVERISPSRVVFDSLSEIRLLAQSPLRYRRQVLALKHFFAKTNCTVLFLDDLTLETDDTNLHSLAHGVVRLEQVALQYGAERRRLRVYKMRGRSFRGGFHDFLIRKGGLDIFPRLVAADHHRDFAEEGPVSSAIPALDRLLGGGLHRGTSTLLLGPAGSGKSTLAMQYVMAGLERGEKAYFISFDETERNFRRRAAGLGMDLSRYKDGQFVFQQVDPAELSPGELNGMIRHHVEKAGARMVVLDSLSGYQNAMPEEHFMLLQMHEMLTYLNQQGVLTLLVLAQHGLVGQMQTPVDLTYVSDTVVLLRYFEAEGEIRRAVSVMKKRTGKHEASIREYKIDSGGLRVGEPLAGFHGVLTGVPTFRGNDTALLETRSDERSPGA